MVRLGWGGGQGGGCCWAGGGVMALGAALITPSSQ